MMPNVAVGVYCSHKVKEMEKSVNVPHRPGGVAHLACAQRKRSEPPLRRRHLARVSRRGRRRASLAAGSVDLQEAPKNLANAINDVEGLEAEHQEVKARQSAEGKKLRATITSSGGQIRPLGR